jgi:hypothetical protein
MVLTNTSLINKGIGFDANNINRSLLLLPWSCYSLTPDKKSIYPLPSFGTTVNQAEQECFNSAGLLKTEVSNNPSVHNGAVRTFWKAPQYGYFDNSRLTKPQPDEYIREIYRNQEEQQNFGIFGDSTKYSKISELFTTFSVDVLDKFEEQFLLFSKSVYDFDTNLEPKSEDLKNEETYENFQGLMRTMFKTQNPDGLTGSALVDKISDNQKNIIQKTIETFMDYQVVFKYGNPSDFDKKLFYSFSSDFIQDPYTWGGYFQNSPGLLPTQGGSITLAQSKNQSPETWALLETYVGFSEIPELQYTDNGSYITDFFIDLDVEFTDNNVKLFAPIIKLYATQKLKNSSLDIDSFYQLMGEYIQKGETYLNLILDNTLTSVRAKIGSVNIKASSTGVKFTEYLGDVSRYDMWDSFKSINDQWIAGADLRSKTIFEDVLLLDRASRDIGQKIFVDIFLLKDLIRDMNHTTNMLGMINTIFENNNFRYWILPAYANFYNIQDVSKNPTPRPEGTLEFANTLFGTHLNVDYRETGAKLVAMYNFKASEHLALNENADYKYRDDAFDLRRASDNPLIENQDGKTNWDKSNKVVGFNVDFGPQNQQIFKQIDIGQTQGQPTQESLEMLNQMANQNRNRSGASQSVSLYNLYRNRSYKCSIDMLGNALMQPMMYFNLRNIPMFSGPYMIEKVEHRISENGFDTTIEGVRQPFYSIPSIDSLLQALNTKILATIKERIKEEKASESLETLNNMIQQTADATNLVSGSKPEVTTTQNCSSSLDSAYTSYKVITASPTARNLSLMLKNIITSVNKQTSITNQKVKYDLINFIFSLFSLNTKDGENFFTYNHNYSNLLLNQNYGGASEYFKKNYVCTSGQKAYAVFEDVGKHIDFVIAKMYPKILVSTNLINQEIGTTDYVKYMAEFIVDNWPSSTQVGTWAKLTETVQKSYLNEISVALAFILNEQTPTTT